MVGLCDPEQPRNSPAAANGVNSGGIYGGEASIVADFISIYRIQINDAPDPVKQVHGGRPARSATGGTSPATLRNVVGYAA